MAEEQKITDMLTVRQWHRVQAIALKAPPRCDEESRRVIQWALSSMPVDECVESITTLASLPAKATEKDRIKHLPRNRTIAPELVQKVSEMFMEDART